MTVAFAPNCSLLVNNTGGNVQSLPDMRVGGKERVWIERIALAGQAPSTQTMVARIPIGSVPLSIDISTDTSLSASTVAFGDLNNASRFSAAGTYTGTNSTINAINMATKGVPLTTVYDYLGATTKPYEDILITTAVSSLPATGTMLVVTKYVDYGA
jgi:hypothetical protein